MDILMSETCWAHKKWNKIASDIKLVFYSSTVTMIHGPINIRKKLSKQLYSTYVVCIQWGGKKWGGHEISHVLYRMDPQHPSYTTHMKSHAHLTSNLPAVYSQHKLSIAVYWTFFLFLTWRWPMSSAETCSCSLCNKFFIYLYHQIKLC